MVLCSELHTEMPHFIMGSQVVLFKAQ
jgi:hypothetical protein